MYTFCMVLFVECTAIDAISKTELTICLRIFMYVKNKYNLLKRSIS